MKKLSGKVVFPSKAEHTEPMFTTQAQLSEFLATPQAAALRFQLGERFAELQAALRVGAYGIAEAVRNNIDSLKMQLG